VTSDDFSAFLACFFSVTPCSAADANGDGLRNPDDISDFINAFFLPCGG
jgi:hypothetical protein